MARPWAYGTRSGAGRAICSSSDRFLRSLGTSPPLSGRIRCELQRCLGVSKSMEFLAILWRATGVDRPPAGLAGSLAVALARCDRTATACHTSMVPESPGPQDKNTKCANDGARPGSHCCSRQRARACTKCAVPRFRKGASSRGPSNKQLGLILTVLGDRPIRQPASPSNLASSLPCPLPFRCRRAKAPGSAVQRRDGAGG